MFQCLSFSSEHPTNIVPLSTACWGYSLIIIIYIYISYEVGGVWVHLWRVQEVHICVILVICECILNALMVHLVLSMFDVTDSLGFPPH